MYGYGRSLYYEEAEQKKAEKQQLELAKILNEIEEKEMDKLNKKYFGFAKDLEKELNKQSAK